jgi:hypothetical protein
MRKWANSPSEFSLMAGYSMIDYDTRDAYLFLRKELEVDNVEKYRKAAGEGKIRHCKPYRGRWFDYTAKKEFDTLEEWVEDAGDTIENVLYGVNRVHKGLTARYVTLKWFLQYNGYVEPSKVQDSFNELIKNLEITDLPVHGLQCIVKKPNDVMVVGRIIDEKYYELEDRQSNICISVPHETQYEVKVYYRLSEMPAGTGVYIRADDGFFRPINNMAK